MTESGRDPITAIALLDEPTRRRLYELVAGAGDAVGRDDAAAALGINRELAAFHLDRLAAGGLLMIEYRRRSGRSGPGAGRPAKLYRRAPNDLAVTLPPRDYAAAATMLAETMEEAGGAAAWAEVAADVARRRGRTMGVSACEASASRATDTPMSSQDVLVEVLDARGFDPDVDGATGDVLLGNCPYRVLSEEHRELICGMNLAWAEGLLDGLSADTVRPLLAPGPGRCCVVFRTGSDGPLVVGDEDAVPFAQS